MYRRKYQGWVKHLDFIILDVLCLQAAFAAAYMLRHGLRSPYEDLIYRNISLILILIDVLVLLGANSFKNRRSRTRSSSVCQGEPTMNPAPTW